MAVTTKKTVYPTMTKEETVIDPFQTTNATQQTVFSIPVATNKAALVSVMYLANTSDKSNVVGGNPGAQAVFRRQSGNITRTSSTLSQGLIQMILGDFAGASQPSLDIVANTSTQSIDIRITGRASTTISWRFEITSFTSND